MKTTDLFIKRPVLAIVVNLFLILVGINAYQQLSLREYPKVETGKITVTTAYVGASADLIQGFITTPIQQAIAGAEGIGYITSSSRGGSSEVSAHLRPGYDADQAMTEVIAKVAQVKSELPVEAEDSVVTKQTSAGSALMYISSRSDYMSGEQVTDYFKRVVQPKLATLEGVAQAPLFGGRTFAMRIWLDPLKMVAFDVTAEEVSDALRRNNYLSTAGQTKGQLVITPVRAGTDLSDEVEFENIVVRQRDDTLVRIKDVAEVELIAESFDSGAFWDGEPSVFVAINLTPSANPLEVSARVYRAVDQLQAEMPEGMVIKVANDSSVFISESIAEVVKTLVEASLIVILVVFLFLGDIRSVVIPVVAIPLSLVGTLFLMWMLGYSLNILTLLALVLAIGLVVDDAIVVVENIHRHIEEGMSAMEAAIAGAREIAMPVISMTLTLAAVYAPIGFLSGTLGTLFSEFAFSLAGAVIISGVVALTLSPMMCSRLLAAKQESGLAHRLDAAFDRLNQGYKRTLASTMRYRPATLVFTAFVLASIPLLLLFSRSEMAPQEDTGVLFIATQAPAYANMDYLNRYTAEYSDIFAKFPEIETAFQFNNASVLGGSFGGITFKPWDERERQTMDIQPMVFAELQKITGLQVFVFAESSLPGSQGGAAVQFVLKSTGSYRKLVEVADRLVDEARASGLFMFISSDLTFDKPELNININRDKAAQLGVSMDAIGNTLAAILGEGAVNRFAVAGRSYKVIPQAAAYARTDTSWINRYYVRSASGEQVPLATFVSIDITTQPMSLNQFQQLNSAKLEGMMAPGVSLGEALDYLNNKAREIMPVDFSLDYEGASRQYLEEGSTLYYVFGVSLLAIFLVLAAQFESFRDPLIILISVPLSICGALIPIFLGYATLNIYSQIGLITLIGLISKHGILIVQFANQLQASGMERIEAVIEAASIRLRPVLMTTAAMVLGVVPLILATGAGAVSRVNIGLVIATGMLIGTLFTLFVVPVVYSYVSKQRLQATSPSV